MTTMPVQVLKLLVHFKDGVNATQSRIVQPQSPVVLSYSPTVLSQSPIVLSSQFNSVLLCRFNKVNTGIFMPGFPLWFATIPL